MENVLKISLSGIPNILPNRKTAFSLDSDKDNIFNFTGGITEAPVITSDEWKTTDYKNTYGKMLVQNVIYQEFNVILYTSNHDAHNLLKLAISAEIETEENNYSVKFSTVESEISGVFYKVTAIGYVLDLAANNVIDYSRSDKILLAYGASNLTRIKIKSDKIILPCNLTASQDISSTEQPTTDKFTFQKVTNGSNSNVFLYLPITEETTAIKNAITATNTQIVFSDKNNYFGTLYLNFVAELASVYKFNITTDAGVWQPDATVSSHAVIECNTAYEVDFYTKMLPKERPIDATTDTIKSNSIQTPVNIEDGIYLDFRLYLSDSDYTAFSRYINRAKIRDIEVTTYSGVNYVNSSIAKITAESAGLQNSIQIIVELPVAVNSI